MAKMTWLLAGAALTLIAGAALAQSSQPPAKDGDRRIEREVRVYRYEDGPQSFVIQRGDRDGDRSVRIERRGRDGDRHVHVVRGGHGREQHLKDVLQLRPNQEPALKAFLEATSHRGARDHVVRFDHRTEGKTTTQRLAEMEAKLAEQQADSRRRIDATRAFYAQLDERQKKAFDAMPMLMMAGPGFGPMLLPGPMHMSHRGPFIPGTRERMRLPPEHVPPVPPAPPPPPR